MAQQLRVEIIGDAASYQRALNKASGSTQKFGSTLGRVGRAAGFAAGAAAFGGLAVVLKAGIGEWQNQTKVAAQTEAVLKSTGGVAGITAKHVDDLATSIMKKSGIDDEAIQSTENLLLAFTKVRNEVGKGNDVFDRATQVITDFSVRTGKSAASAAQLFGKALNEIAQGQIPAAIRGVGKLSQATQEEIKAHLAAGDAAGAQGVLLDQLEQKYGGAAEAAGKTLPGQIAILREEFNNFAGDLVAKTIPVIEDLIAWLKDHWPEIQAALQSFWSSAKPIIVELGALLQAIWPIAQKAIEIFLPVLENMAKVIADIVKLVAALLRGDWSQAWQAAKAIVVDVAKQIGLEVKALGQAILAVLGGAFEKLGGLARQGLDAVVGAIRGIIGAAGDAAASLGTSIVNGIADGLSALGRKLIELIVRPINYVIGKINAIKIPGFSFSVDTHLPGVGTVGFSFPGFDPIPGDIPMLAKGGIVRSPTLAMVGERGPEAVIPLNRMGGHVVNVTVQGALLGTSVPEVARTIHRELLRLDRRNAGLGFT